VSLVDDLLPTIEICEQIAADLGVRPFTVAIRVEQYSGRIEDGATLLAEPAQPDLLLAPAPRVVAAGAQQSSWFGAGTYFSDGGGPTVMRVYRVGPITPKYTSAQLQPPVGQTQRLVWWLTGPGQKPGGEPYELAEPLDDGDPTGWFATIKRAVIV
jgi:hypothetical protein